VRSIMADTAQLKWSTFASWLLLFPWSRIR
jgi:hypothetical protein